MRNGLLFNILFITLRNTRMKSLNIILIVILVCLIHAEIPHLNKQQIT